MKQGRMINNQMTNYIIPTAADLPPIRVCFLEQRSSAGPGGARLWRSVDFLDDAFLEQLIDYLAGGRLAEAEGLGQRGAGGRAHGLETAHQRALVHATHPGRHHNHIIRSP